MTKLLSSLSLVPDFPLSFCHCDCSLEEAADSDQKQLYSSVLGWTGTTVYVQLHTRKNTLSMCQLNRQTMYALCEVVAYIRHALFGRES